MKQLQKIWRRHRKGLLITVGSIFAVLVVVNGVVALHYHSRMYPHTTVLGLNVSNQTYQAAESKVRQQNPLPATLQLSYKDKQSTAKTAELGIYIDASKLPEAAKQSRSWPPMLQLFTKHIVQAPVRIDQARYADAVNDLSSTFKQDPTPAHIAYDQDQFKAVQAAAGWQLNAEQLQPALINGITHNQTVTMPVTAIAPPAKMANPGKALQAVQSQLKTALTFQFGSKSSKASPQDVASWYTQDHDSFIISEDAVRTYIAKAGASLGVAPQNTAQATAKVVDALKNSHSTDVKLFAKVATYHYCVALKGVSSSNLPELEKRAASAYTDSRGWSLDGQVVFKQVSSGCDYTVWLTAADQMPSFGAICDSTWSCTINNNVVINFDRWQNATSTWNAAHAGTLEEYRNMAINHETGHQLGFEHSACTTPGKPAPVMEQQSIDLQGCTFNAWPLPSEQNMLRVRLGL